MDHMPGGAGERPFAELAAGECPPYAELLLALSAEFGAVDTAWARERLDDDSRALFGVASLSPLARADSLAAVLGGELGLRPTTGAGAAGLLLDRVLCRREGHPALLAAIGAELARRAGVPAGVYASPSRWFVGLGHGDDLVVLDAALDDAAGEPPHELRPACAHELAFCLLCGLATAYTQAGRDADARHAGRLRLALPVVPRGA